MALRVFIYGWPLEMVVDLGTPTRCNQETPDVSDALKRARQDDYSAHLRKNEETRFDRGDFRRTYLGMSENGVYPQL